MKDRFKEHFGTSFDDFMDENKGAESSTSDSKVQGSELEFADEEDRRGGESGTSTPTQTMAATEREPGTLVSRDKDELLLDRLQWANNQIEKQQSADSSSDLALSTRQQAI